MEEMTSQYVDGRVAKTFDEIRLPVVAVNADLWPIDDEANRRHMLSFEAIVLKETDHFLMLTRAEEFNKALEQAIGEVLHKARIEGQARGETEATGVAIGDNPSVRHPWVGGAIRGYPSGKGCSPVQREDVLR